MHLFLLKEQMMEIQSDCKYQTEGSPFLIESLVFQLWSLGTEEARNTEANRWRVLSHNINPKVEKYNHNSVFLFIWAGVVCGYLYIWGDLIVLGMAFSYWSLQLNLLCSVQNGCWWWVWGHWRLGRSLEPCKEVPRAVWTLHTPRFRAKHWITPVLVRYM